MTAVTGRPTADVLRRLGLSTDHLEDYRSAWNTHCPHCGVPDGPCLNNQGQRQSRPHPVRLGVAQRAANAR